MLGLHGLLLQVHGWEDYGSGFRTVTASSEQNPILSLKGERNPNLETPSPIEGSEELVLYFSQGSRIWGFPKIRGTLFWGPYNKDYYLGCYIRVPYFRKLPYVLCKEPQTLSPKPVNPKR